LKKKKEEEKEEKKEGRKEERKEGKEEEEEEEECQRLPDNNLTPHEPWKCFYTLAANKTNSLV